MAQWTRSELAVEANELASHSRRVGAPRLTAASSFETLLEWLAWADPNGEWSNEEVTEYELNIDDLWDNVAVIMGMGA